MDDAFVQHGTFSWCELMTTDVAAASGSIAGTASCSLSYSIGGSSAPAHSE